MYAHMHLSSPKILNRLHSPHVDFVLLQCIHCVTLIRLNSKCRLTDLSILSGLDQILALLLSIFLCSWFSGLAVYFELLSMGSHQIESTWNLCNDNLDPANISAILKLCSVRIQVKGQLKSVFHLLYQFAHGRKRLGKSCEEHYLQRQKMNLNDL